MPVSRWLGLLGLVAAAVLVSGCGGAPAAAPNIPARIHKIRHVIVVMQENRSFDSYFGTYPGADGLPKAMFRGAGCNVDPATRRCVWPFHDRRQVDFGGPHSASAMKPSIFPWSISLALAGLVCGPPWLLSLCIT